MNHIMIQNTNPKTKPKSKHDSHETSKETCLHACQPNYYSNLHVTLDFAKNFNSIRFFKEQSFHVNIDLIDC